MKKKLLLTFILLYHGLSYGQVKLPKIFADSMVLQRNQAIPIWGWAGKNEKITVRLNKQSKTIKAGNDGKWKILLKPEQAGGPFQLTVKGKNTITINDVLVGEVWVCSGQSNMEWPVSSVDNANMEIQEAHFPDVRQFFVPHQTAGEPQEEIQGEVSWKAATPGNVGNFTAVGYFFAKELYKDLHIPIGLISTNWGGTDIETWISREAFTKSDEFKDMIAHLPRLNLDSISQIRTIEKKKFLEQLQGGLPEKGSTDKWKQADFDDSKWPKMMVPGFWEAQALKDFDGVVWFRKTIDLSSENAGQSAVLDIGMIDDSDETYINGIKIGTTISQWNVKRSYPVPAGVLKPGKNVVTVKVIDNGGGGGLHGEPSDFKLVINKKVVPLAGEWLFQVESIPETGSSVNPNSYPTLLFNAMIHPLIPYAIKGVIWYQGENNAGRAYQYRQAFPLMIQDWRNHWGQGDFPFYFVQLSSFNAGNGDSQHGSTWAELREAQTLTLSMTNTGMAVTTDIGNPKDIHPKNKQDVGKRLAAIALHETYGKNIVFSGPVFQSMATEGNKAILSFTFLGSGLMTKDKYGYVRGFEIAGEDHKFYYAKAFIDGDKVVVYNERVTTPLSVRYAWADDASDANLYNIEGFPAVPFRTDQWKGITEGKQYKIP